MLPNGWLSADPIPRTGLSARFQGRAGAVLGGLAKTLAQIKESGTNHAIIGNCGCSGVRKKANFVHVISKKSLREFWEKHPESRTILMDWFKKAKEATAKSFPELRNVFGSADYVDGFTIYDFRRRRKSISHYCSYSLR